MTTEPYVPAGWTPEAWQEQMYVEVKVAYRLSELGLVQVDEDTPYDADETARVDAEYDNWLARHDAKVKADALREAAEDNARRAKRITDTDVRVGYELAGGLLRELARRVEEES